MSENGVFYSAFGNKAIAEALASIETLKLSNPELGVCVATDDVDKFTDDRKVSDIPKEHLIYVENDRYGRKSKLNCDQLSPFTKTLYLDADTRVFLPLDFIFDTLDKGWELIFTVSASQYVNWLWHIPEDERTYTLNTVGWRALQMQGGIFAFRKTPAIRSFFATWRKEYDRFPNVIYDQAALARTFAKKSLKMLLVGSPYNGGSVIDHRFGRARRNDDENEGEF